MSTDISRVYIFLAKQGDWVSAADKNGDGTVIKSEFRDFMEENFEWDGETTEDGKNDLINNFWKSIDTNQSGKISGTRLKNKNALDKNEIAAMENKIKVYEILNNFVDEIDAPDVVNDQYAWKKSLADSLGNFVETFIKQGGKAEDLEAKLNAELPAVKARTTADYVAQEYIEEVLSDVENYARSDDKTLKGIIDKYIAEIKKLGTDNLPSDEEIQAKVKELVDAYLATAGAGDGDVADLQNYGYSPKDKSPMNDLQKAVLLTEAISAVKADAVEKERYDMSPEGYESALSAFIDSLKYGDFKTHQGSVMALFKNSSFYNTIQEKVEEASLAKTREEAIKYCNSTYKQGGLFKEAVDNIFGSDYAQSINEMDAATIESNLSQLKEIVASYDISGMTQAEKDAMFYGISNSYNLSLGATQTFNIANSATCNGNIITTDRISYKATGAVSVDASGKVTLNTSTPGTFNSTLIVLIDGKQIASKTIVVNVENKFDAKSIVSSVTDSILPLNSSVDNWNNDDSFKDLYNGDKNIILYGKADKKNKDWSHMKDTIKNNLTSLGNLVVSILATAGLDKDKLNEALKFVVKDYYNAGAIKYKNSSGSGGQGSMINKGNNNMSTHRNETKSRIVWTVDETGRDSNIYQIHFKGFVDDIIAKYNELIK